MPALGVPMAAGPARPGNQAVRMGLRAEYDERHEDMSDHLRAVYRRIADILEWGPLPIGVPKLHSGIFAESVHRSLVTAYTVLQDLPMDDAEKALMGSMVLDWVTASQQMFSYEEDPEEWKLDVVSIQLRRIYSSVVTLARLLTGE